MLTSRNDVKKFVMMSKNMSWHQKHLMTSKMFVISSQIWSQWVCHNVKKFVMTSKTRHDIKRFVVTNKSWRQKVCHDVKNTTLKYIMMSNTRHDVKKFVMKLKTHDVKNFVMMSKIHHDVKKFVIMSKTLHDAKKFFMTSKIHKKNDVRNTSCCQKCSCHQKVSHDVKSTLWI